MRVADVRPGAEELIAALRLGAEGDPTTRAAVELVIAHQHWLRRTPFLRLILWYPADESDPNMAMVLWAEVAELLDHDAAHDLYDSGSERGLLRTAACIARGWLGDALTSCDAINVELIAHAVLVAGGVAR